MGMSVRQYQNLEKEGTPIKKPILIALSVLYGVSLAYMLGDSDIKDVAKERPEKYISENEELSKRIKELEETITDISIEKMKLKKELKEKEELIEELRETDAKTDFLPQADKRKVSKN